MYIYIYIYIYIGFILGLGVQGSRGYLYRVCKALHITLKTLYTYIDPIITI